MLRTPDRRYGRLLGVGTYRPRRTVGNGELPAPVDTTGRAACQWDEKWIESRSGIRSRRFAAADETLPAMAVTAGGKALAHAGITPDQVSCVLVASMSYLVQTPPLSIEVAHELGAVNAAGFDVSGACAGFCHALGVAGDMVSTGNAEYVLVIGVERMTDIVDPADRSIAFLFADGAGAVVVGPADRPGIGPVVRGADGEHLEALHMNTGWAAFRDDPGLPRPMMKMNGRRVFTWAVDHVLPAARLALDQAGLDPGDLAAFIPHQANARMTEVMAKRLGLPDHVAVADDVATSGNTSAASIPLAMERVLDGSAAGGGPALLVGFGAGLNYAALVVLMP